MIQEFCWFSWFNIGQPGERSGDRIPSLAICHKIIDQKLLSLPKHQYLSMLVVSDKDDKLLLDEKIKQEKRKNNNNAMLASVEHSCWSLNILKVYCGAV